MHRLLSQDKDERIAGAVDLERRLTTLEHQVASNRLNCDHEDAMIRKDLDVLTSEVREHRAALGSTPAVTVMIDALKGELATLKERFAEKSNKVAGGWFVVTLAAAVLMGAVSLIKQFT